MRIIILSILFILPFFVVAQKDSTKKNDDFEEIIRKTPIPSVPKTKPKSEVFEAVEEVPQYPGGDEARAKFIQKHLAYPDSSLKYGRQGKVYVKFVVEKDSSLSRVHTVKSFDEESALEAIRVTKMMRWIPGKQKGKAVPVWVVMPIVFRIK